MTAPRLRIFAFVTSLILLTYSHRPIILRFQEVNSKSSGYDFAGIC